jgi:hypothetical protein
LRSTDTWVAGLAAFALLQAGGCRCTYPAQEVATDSATSELFDGATLSGWVQRGGKASFSVEDGCIVGRTAPNQPNSFLCTTSDYADFVLTLAFKVDSALNSGIQIRSASDPAYQNGRVHGYQVEIDPSDRAWMGGIYDEGRRGWLDDLSDKPDARVAFKHNDWNTLRIEAVGDHIRTWLNGVPAGDLHDSMTRSGFIALQVHGVGERADPLEVRWRHIRLRPMSLPVTDPSNGAGPDRSPAPPASR